MDTVGVVRVLHAVADFRSNRQTRYIMVSCPLHTIGRRRFRGPGGRRGADRLVGDPHAGRCSPNVADVELRS
jgi:hypothetical protein